MLIGTLSGEITHSIIPLEDSSLSLKRHADKGIINHAYAQLGSKIGIFAYKTFDIGIEVL